MPSPLRRLERVCTRQLYRPASCLKTASGPRIIAASRRAAPITSRRKGSPLTDGARHVAYAHAGWTGFVHPDCPPTLRAGDPLAALLAQPHETIRERPAARTVRLSIDGTTIYAKHNTGGRRSRLLVRRNYQICRRMQAAGFGTPTILLAAWSGSGPGMQSLLVTRAVEAPTLDACVRAGGDREQMSRVLRMVGRRVAELHQRRFVHGDLLPGNVLLVGGGDDLAYLDNDRTRRWPIVPPETVRMQNLAQLLFRLMSRVAWRSTRQMLLSYFDAMGMPERRRRAVLRKLIGEVRRRRRRRGFVRIKGRGLAGR